MFQKPFRVHVPTLVNVVFANFCGLKKQRVIRDSVEAVPGSGVCALRRYERLISARSRTAP